MPIKRIVLFVIVAILGAGLVFAYQRSSDRTALPEGLIQANGRIEGDTIIVASKQAERIADILVDEGDAVAKDQVMARLDNRSVMARVKQARAAVDVANAVALQCVADLDLLASEIPIRVDSASADMSIAKARLLKAQAEQGQASREHNRYATLAQQGTVSSQIAERANTRLQQANDEELVAQSLVTKARQSLNDARLGPQRIRSKEAQVAALEATAAEAKARLGEVLTVLDDLVIHAPIAGTITERFADPGEVVGVGMPLFELVNLDRLYLTVFVPESKIGKVRLGVPAQIYSDAFPDEPFMARVSYIASRAEFTPKDVQTPDERVKLVYEVKLLLADNPDHRLTPGLPADAVIRWKEDAPWAKPAW